MDSCFVVLGARLTAKVLDGLYTLFLADQIPCRSYVQLAAVIEAVPCSFGFLTLLNKPILFQVVSFSHAKIGSPFMNSGA